jgi:pimeloyl-ACP methyl ester carboxylesterase
MAAEALLDQFDNAATVEALKFGNERSSRFTTIVATEFASQWIVVAHQASSGAGFSGTLFRYRGQTDVERSLVENELVMSFRSTEFVDDSARDSEATNQLEIQPFGWAFGQMADMEAWYGRLKQEGKITSPDKFAVTGYSLGGHLATAFSQLRADETLTRGIANPITSTYTFNGAGVGELVGGATLAQVINQFSQERRPEHTHLFQTAAAKQLYATAAELMKAHTMGGVQAALALAASANFALPPPNMSSTLLRAEITIIFEAIKRAEKVAFEAGRAPALSSGDPEVLSPAKVEFTRSDGTVLIDAIGLNYQLAVLRASTLTSAFKSGLIDSVGLAYAPRASAMSTLPASAPIFDIYGAPPPSAVASSQDHYGAAVPISPGRIPSTEG